MVIGPEEEEEREEDEVSPKFGELAFRGVSQPVHSALVGLFLKVQKRQTQSSSIQQILG